MLSNESFAKPLMNTVAEIAISFAVFLVFLSLMYLPIFAFGEGVWPDYHVVPIN